MKLESPLLSAVPGLRHAFFNREGGVSGGVYAGLNGGIGSNDDPVNVAENRRRMAHQLGVRPQHLLTAYQVHSPDAVVASAPWAISPARVALSAAIAAGLAEFTWPVRTLVCDCV